MFFFFVFWTFYLIRRFVKTLFDFKYERKKKETKQTINLFLLPNNFQILLERFFDFVLSMLFDIIGKEGQKHFIFLYTLIIFILVFNLIGLVPFSFTITSHLVNTFSLSLLVFFAINFLCVYLHKTKIFSLFLPPGSSFYLALLLVPIELVSYFFRPISLSVRLFANMMAGHTLLKVIVGFAIVMFCQGGSFYILHLLIIFLLFCLMFLEFSVSLIQAYVFGCLICIYLSDAINLH